VALLLQSFDREARVIAWRLVSREFPSGLDVLEYVIGRPVANHRTRDF
jgi:hypothetical protein